MNPQINTLNYCVIENPQYWVIGNPNNPLLERAI